MAVIAMMLAAGAPAAASDVDLGNPQTLEELLASPEYLDDEHADVARLYQAFFDRVPDVGGLAYWIDVYEDGTPVDELSWLFSNSPEFQLTYGADLTNAEFLEIVYVNVLGRDYDQEGFDYWLGEMGNGLLRHQAVFYIVAGQEFITEYPFAGTAPDVRDALIDAADVRAYRPGFTVSDAGRYTLTEADLAARSACSQLRFVHTNTWQVFHATPDSGEFVVQDQYAFSDTAGAIAVMDNHRLLTQPACSTQTRTYDDGSVLTQQYRSFSDTLFFAGDDSLIISATWTWNDGTTYEFYLFVIRDQNVITITDITVRGFGADYASASVWAEDTSARVQNLLAAS